MVGRLSLFLCLALVLGCGEDAVSGAKKDKPDPPDPVCEVGNDPPCQPNERDIDGCCIPPGYKDNGCFAGDYLAADGSCVPAGLPPEGIAPPPPSCPSGTMALPGETDCREVAPCGAAPWGDIPLDESAIYVDASAPVGGNGSQGAPYSTIADALTGATSGSLIAVADGTYGEPVLVPAGVQVWGRCPAHVSVQRVELLGDGASVHTLAVNGISSGVEIAGNGAMLIDRLWIHDHAGRGVVVENVGGRPSVIVDGTLIERVRDIGMLVLGSDITINDTIVRELAAMPNGNGGRGIHLQNDDVGARTVAMITRTVVERTTELGLLIGGCDATVEDSIVVDTAARPDGSEGGGIQAQLNRPTMEPAVAHIVGSHVLRNTYHGVTSFSSMVTIERSVISETRPQASDGALGRGVRAEPDMVTNIPGTMTLRDSLLANNHDIGVFASLGQDLLLERSVVQGTLPRASDADFGRGVNIQFGGVATLIDSVIADNHDVGVFVAGAELVMEGTRVSGTQPAPGDPNSGRAIGAQLQLNIAAPATVTVRTSALLDSIEAGLLLIGGTGGMETTLIDGVAMRPDGNYGDGATVMTAGPRSSLWTSQLQIQNATRAGLATFGADLTVGLSRLACNAIDLDTEVFDVHEPLLINAGENACGCDQVTECKAVSTNLLPPEPPADPL